ncbi:MAG: peptidoglycan-binding protein [Bacteroidales bacterium]|nr:peptidoglycan-binding protein [Bacteroidales bacterium]
MANIEILAPFILSFEGGFVNDPRDSGGATNKGVTLRTWREVGYDKDGDHDIDVADLKLITAADVVDKVLRPFYWNVCKADAIASQSVANMLVDWAYNSGAKTAIRQMQRLLGCEPDGIVGRATLAALDRRNPVTVFEGLRAARRTYIDNVVAAHPEKEAFRKGWMRRIDSIEWCTLRLNDRNGTKMEFADR